jgi:hypothetical protein
MIANRRQHPPPSPAHLGILIATLLVLGGGLAGAVSLEQGFRTVPDAAKPWVYWWWLNGNIDERTISRDLEAMRQQGFGGLLLFDARGYHDDQNHVVMPPARTEFMSPEWRGMLKFALNKAHELGLEVSVNLSSCAGALKGPWEVGNDAPKRLLWTSTELTGPQKFNSRLHNPAEKRFWNVAVIAVRQPARMGSQSGQWQELAPSPDEKRTADAIVELTPRLRRDGQLAWDVPEGDWTLLQFGCATMEGHEYDVDILDPKAVEGHFARMGKAVLQEAGHLAGKTLTHFYSVSWEGAAPTWTLTLEKEFAVRRGYALRPWLPVLAGFTVRSREQSERFLKDYYRTLGDCFRDNFYGTMQRLCRRHGLKWHSESGGPWNRKLAAFGEADQLAFLARNDMPQGEFWFAPDPARRRQDLNRPAAMTAHIYGKNLAATEAFTHMLRHWSAYPAALKPFADSAFCDGINHFIWHTFTASPEDFGTPGSEYFAGTHINPNVTWSAQAGPFVRYLGRCQFMLRQGLYVSDVCVYIGDRPYQHWGRGMNWSSHPTVILPKGYTYDLVNTEVLLNRLRVKDGNLRLPDGMSYRLLIVDLEDEQIPAGVLGQIAKLKKAGATVVLGQRRPRLSPGLANYPDEDTQVRRLANGLWTGSPSLVEALREKQPLPDFEGPCDYIHRRSKDADIYFLSGSGPAECVFRVSGKVPEFWDAVTGEMKEAARWGNTDDGRTRVFLTLPQSGSGFVVFRRPGEHGTHAEQRPVIEKDLTGPWNISFPPGRGAPDSAVFEELSAWNEHSDEGIRFFSGTATYRKSFALTADEAGRALRLRLGRVECIAWVRLNEKDLGVVWTDPWAVELGNALKPGRNELEIEVTNTWVNRLIGDCALPPPKRFTKTNVALQSGPRTLKPYQGFASEDPLMTSGLLGPVRLELDSGLR